MGCVVWKRRFLTAEEGRRRKARMERINLMIDGESVERERLERGEGGRQEERCRSDAEENQSGQPTNQQGEGIGMTVN